MCEFNYIEMSKSKNTTQTSLEELYTTDDLTVLKRAITELTAKRDYKTLNTLFRRNPNASKFDTRELNEEIPCDVNHFTERKGVMKFEYQPGCKATS